MKQTVAKCYSDCVIEGDRGYKMVTGLINSIDETDSGECYSDCVIEGDRVYKMVTGLINSIDETDSGRVLQWLCYRRRQSVQNGDSTDQQHR
jgi:hypothetical protein